MEIAKTISSGAIGVADHTQVGEARRFASRFSSDLGMSEQDAGKVSIIVTEAATNLALHGKGGEVLLSSHLEDGGFGWVDVLAIDRGPGIRNIPQSLADGYSTAGTPGNGLGAISRLSDRFDLYSQPGGGTVLLARVASSTWRNSSAAVALQAASVCVPKAGERVSGDCVAIRIEGSRGDFLVADGLGHGIGANEASAAATRIFLETKQANPVEVIDLIHRGLRPTRGAAVAVASIDCERNRLSYSGIGNIAGTILNSEASRSLVSHNGIAGHQCHRIQEFGYDWSSAGVLVMNSDGLLTNWRLNQYPGLLAKDPAIIAAILYRDFSRQRDDVAVLVVKPSAHA